MCFSSQLVIGEDVIIEITTDKTNTKGNAKTSLNLHGIHKLLNITF